MRGRGVTETEAMKLAYYQDPTAYRSNAKKFEFDSTIYGAESIKKVLIQAQFGKCCFCESSVTPISHGDVEHFRPKGAFRQSHDEPEQFPGYYWLAYEWNNLLFSCQVCNQTFKQAFFPLEVPDSRARSHYDNLSAESPLLINPAEEDPEEFITFYKEVIRAVDGNQRGAVTIENLGLDRPKLEEQRRTRFEDLKVLWEIIQLANEPDLKANGDFQRVVQDARERLKEAVLDSAQYAGMIRAAVRANFTY